MSMIVEYLRVTADELDRVIQDPDWALGFVEEVQDAEEESEPAPAESRHFGTCKTWDMLRFLLARAEFPVNVIHGEELFADDERTGGMGRRGTCGLSGSGSRQKPCGQRGRRSG